jgi:hypothetical protein
MLNCRHLVRAFVLILLLAIFSTVFVSRAFGQGFTLTQITELGPVNPGGSSTATLELQGTGGFAGTVSFTTPCAVTPSAANGPVCTVSPASSTPSAQGAQISVTVTTVEATTPGTYQITVTATSGTLAPVTVQLGFGVSTLTENYTLSVTPTTATPSPVPAGSTATTVVMVTPIGSYSGHTVTLSCLSVTPLAEPVPVCSFNPQQVSVTGGTAPTSTLSIITIGPAPTSRLWNRRVFYALWLLAPGLGVFGLAATGTRRKHAMAAFLVVMVMAGFWFIPACSSSRTVGDTTPTNTFTFTITAVDENGAGPSNTTTGEATATVAVN